MWIKICGVNDLATVRAIGALRPDAIGLNFFERSIRFVSNERARQIVEALPREIEAIGVFVEAPPELVRQTVELCQLSGVQFHGEGAEEAFAAVGDLRHQRAGAA